MDFPVTIVGRVEIINGFPGNDMQRVAPTAHTSPTAALYYNLTLVAVSIAVAIAASFIALWLAFQLRHPSRI